MFALYARCFLLAALAQWLADGLLSANAKAGQTAMLEASVPQIAHSLIVAFLTASLIALGLALPLQRVRRAITAIAARDGAADTNAIAVAQAGSARGDVFAPLGLEQTIAELVRRVDEAIAERNRLMHDLACQLVRPLARIKLALGLASQQPDRAPFAIQRLERESDRLDALATDVLAWSRASLRPRVAQAEEVDLRELLADVIADTAQLTGPGGPAIHFLEMERAAVRGDPELLHRALVALVQHCLQRAHRLVVVRLAAAKGVIRVFLSDDGGTVTRAHCEALFVPSITAPHVAAHPQAACDTVHLRLATARQILRALGGTVGASPGEPARADGAAPGSRVGDAPGGILMEIRLPAC